MCTTVSTPAPSAPTATRPTALVVVMMVAALMDLLDVTVVNVALPTLRAHLHASPSQLEWIVAGYLLAFGSTLIVWGRIGDLVGRRRVFLAAVAVFGAASLAAGTSGGIEWLIVFRVLQGGAAGALVPQVLATFRTALPPAMRMAAFGVYGAVAGLAAAVGVVLGGVFTQESVLGLGWRAIFLVNVPVAAVVLVAGAVVVPESRPVTSSRLPWPTMVGLPVAFAAIVHPLTEGRAHGWPLWMVAEGVAGVVLLAAAVAVDARRDRVGRPALVRPQQFRVAAFSFGLGVQALFSAALQGFSLAFVLWLQAGHRWTPLHTGLTLLAFSAGAMITAPVAGQLAQTRGRRVLASGAVLLVLGVGVAALPAWRTSPSPSLWAIVPGLVLGGAGLGLLVVPLVNVVLAAVPDDAAGGASGVFSTAQQLGGALGIAVIGSMFFAHERAPHLDTAFGVAAVAACVGYAAAGALSLRLPRRAVSDERLLELG
ncbi:MAG: MFS transporter [Jatrophihabitans sp.]|uniref:MFS transporter n=1 Tax=Jatrophihabitans sp. TaxID=1932789 RepID=UPI003F7F15EA